MASISGDFGPKFNLSYPLAPFNRTSPNMSSNDTHLAGMEVSTMSM
jgi:hypothetical protein